MSTFLVGFVTGILSGFFSNYLYAQFIQWRIGKKPFITSKVSGNVIHIEGQIDNTITGQTVLSNLNREICNLGPTTTSL